MQAPPLPVAPPVSAHPATPGDAAATTAAHPGLDDEMRALLEAFHSLQPGPVAGLDLERARARPTLADAVLLRLARQHRSADPKDLEPGVDSRPLRVDGADGTLPARLYRPVRATGALPAVLYFHGGGGVVGGADGFDGSARSLCAKAQALVLAVDCRLAPEHPFPAAWDDAQAAWRWLHAHAASLGGDPTRLALAGESTGGTLALATALAARDAGAPAPVHVLAVCPLASPEVPAAADGESDASAADALHPLDAATLHWLLSHLLPRPQDRADPRVNLVAADLAGLPPVSLVTAEADPLHPHGERLQAQLLLAGVAAERRHFVGVTHGFFGAAPVLQKAREAQAWAAERLRAAFALQAAPLR